jgi:hypothetical protein
MRPCQNHFFPFRRSRRNQIDFAISIFRQIANVFQQPIGSRKINGTKYRFHI